MGRLWWGYGGATEMSGRKGTLFPPFHRTAKNRRGRRKALGFRVLHGSEQGAGGGTATGEDGGTEGAGVLREG